MSKSSKKATGRKPKKSPRAKSHWLRRSWRLLLLLGGIFLGLIESVGPSLFLDGLGIVAPYQLKDAIAFTMLVLVLIFRPTGIMGERLAVKKA